MQKVIKVTIKDMGTDKNFSVRLFGAMEGIDFVESLMTLDKGISVKAVLADLLPLATLLDGTGGPGITMSFGTIDTYFESPLAPLELGMKILEHQMVFMNESEVFRKFSGRVQHLFNMQTSDSQIS